MHSELQGNVIHHGVELLLLVSMLFLLAIPKSLLILKEFLYTISYSGTGHSPMILAVSFKQAFALR